MLYICKYRTKRKEELYSITILKSYSSTMKNFHWQLNSAAAFSRHGTTPGTSTSSGQIFVASYTALLEGVIRERAPVHFSLRQRLLHRFPNKYITQLLGRFLPHEFLQTHDKQDLQSDPTREKEKKKPTAFFRSGLQTVQLQDMSASTANSDGQQDSGEAGPPTPVPAPM